MTDTGRAALIAALIMAGAAWYVLRDDLAGTIDAGWVDAAPESDYAPDFIDYGNQVTEQVQDFFEGGDEMTRNANLMAFLLAIRPGEGTAGPDGYRTLFGGDLFGSFDAHPAQAGWPGVRLRDDICAKAGFGPGCVSTAAGAYQINKPTWARLQRIIGYGDFSPARQDAAAIQLIKEKGAFADVCAGRIEQAVAKCRKVWASLPGAGYGQREVSLAGFLADYNRAGGVLV